MAYATVSQMLERFGAEELAQRADRSVPRLLTAALLTAAAAGADISAWTAEEQAAAAAAVALIAQANDDAASDVDGYLAPRYTVPLAAPVPPTVVRIACDLARYYIFEDMATELIARRRDEAVAALRDIASGRATLGTAVGASAPVAGGALVEMTTPGRVFGRHENGGLG